MVNLNHCCQEMERSLTLDCKKHLDIYSCPDVLIRYIPKFDEYGIIIHDDGTAMDQIKFCPWCGHKLATSKRDAWFDKLEKLGFDEPSEQGIPEEFKSDAWYRKS